MTSSTALPEAPDVPVPARTGARPVLPALLGARVANILLTAQVQLAYACAVEARARAQRASDCVHRTWPDTPLRALVIDAYGAQAHAADEMAHSVLANARRRCGLAFAAF